MALPVFAPLFINTQPKPADEPPAEQPPAYEPPAEESVAVIGDALAAEAVDNAVTAARITKINRFARRYFWGYPSAGNCFRYRRERL